MANNNNNQQQPQNLTDNMLDNVVRHSRRTGDPAADAIYELMDRLESGRFGNFSNYSRASTESQSSISEKGKWSFETGEEYHSRGDLLKDFENGIKDELMNSLAGGNFKKGIQSALDTFTKTFGFDLKNIGHEAGKALMKKGVDIFKDSKFGQAAIKKAKGVGNWALDKAFGKQGEEGKIAKQGILDMVKAFRGGGQGGLGKSIVSNQKGTFFDTLAKGGGKGGKIGEVIASKGGNFLASTVGKTGAGGALAGKGLAVLGKGAAALGPWGLLIAGIVFTIVKVLGPALKGLAEMAKALGKSFNREEDMRKKRLENAQKRLKEDVDYLTKEPFEILKKAVEQWTNVWDSNLRQIGQTQGYDKESVYALYESYAERLREEGLGSVINATDVVEKLSSVLNSGLTGKAAEEFAYAATKLNAAIPNQDFFSYVDTYASIAANAISQGASQEQALAQANQQLEDFASNLLYSSRELAGGFSTGLKNSASLFQQATQIAQTAKSGNANAISGTLTSVSAIIGAVAPDLADSLVSNVVQAAIGGNSSSLVALRSLAGVNAGNTEFLQAMAEDPKAIFSELFTNLAQMQSMSPDNYMEVAEGLAEVFGIDKAAFARVDFNYLANAINSMNVNNQSLQENMALLASGQTTTSAEQLKAQEINRVILEEGLAYVIDSEAGRAIQEHMWEEQQTNALMENEYAVSLQGAALTFLEGIRKTMTTLMNFLNPIGFIAKGVSNMQKTIAESVGNDEDIQEVLKLGAVGGNARAFGQLTTRGKDLGLTTPLVEMMGGTKGIAAVNKITDLSAKFNNAFASITGSLLTGVPMGTSSDINSAYDAITGLSANMPNKGSGVTVSSKYTWGQVGKSVAQAIQSTPMNKNTIGSVVKASTESATKLAQDKSNERFEKFLDTAKDAANTMSYEQWVDTAKLHGISDFSQALDDYGRTEEELKNFFEQNEALAGAKEEQKIRDEEKLFRDDTRAYWDYSAGTSGAFYTAIWYPFFGEGQKYDTRMDAVDLALADIQGRIGSKENHTVISGIEELSRKVGNDAQHTVISIMEALEADISKTFMTGSLFQKCLHDWESYILSKESYNTTIKKSSAWSDVKAAQGETQNQALLALSNAMNKFTSTDLQKLDPQLQTNALLGEIVIILQAIMQQNNTQAGGLSLMDTISALGLGVTKR